MADVAGLRINYDPKNPFDLKSLAAKDPMGLFKHWFEEARGCEQIIEPNAMTIATSNSKGIPSARMVLLKGFDTDCFKFYTNYESRKAKDIAENNNVALMFYWEPLHKSVRVEGIAEKLSEAESTEYFKSRPHGSQLGACVSHQSTPISSHQDLLDKWEELKKKHPDADHPIDKPDFWGGIRIIPNTVEFWQGQSSRLHKRVKFTKGTPEEVHPDLVTQGDNGWTYHLLSS